MALCSIAVLCFVEAYGFQTPPGRLAHYGPHYCQRPVFWNKITLNVLRLTVAFLVYAAVLEIGQAYVGRRAAIEDYLINAAGIVVTIAALLPVHRWLALGDAP